MVEEACILNGDTAGCDRAVWLGYFIFFYPVDLIFNLGNGSAKFFVEVHPSRPCFAIPEK